MDIAAGEMRQATIMIHVQMRQDDFLGVARTDAQRLELRSYPLLVLDLESDFHLT